MKRMIGWLSCLVLAACSHLPANIEDPPAVDISYQQVIQNPQNYQNTLVRWGGTIIDVENQQTQSLIQVLVYPLNSYGRPYIDQAAVGRFIIKSSEFFDPAVYTKNSAITVAGIVHGDLEKAVGQKVLKLPVIIKQTLYIWPAYDPNSRFYDYGGYYGFGGYGPYWGGYGGLRGRWGYPYGGYYWPYPGRW